MKTEYDKKEKLKIIFVLGTAHSGTTILYNMLSLHSDLSWFSQFSQRDGKVKGRIRIPFHALMNRFLRSKFTHDWRKVGGGNLSKKRDLGFYLIPKPGEMSSVWKSIEDRNKKISYNCKDV